MVNEEELSEDGLISGVCSHCNYDQLQKLIRATPAIESYDCNGIHTDSDQTDSPAMAEETGESQAEWPDESGLVSPVL